MGDRHKRMTGQLGSIDSEQQGMVSILVCMIMMIVITLVVLGFSQLSRSQLTETLNRQLSTEAFYAADSGINNTAAYIKAQVAAGLAGNITDQTTCNSITNGPYNKSANLDTTSAVSYTCVTVTAAPSSLSYDIPAGSSAAFPITPSAAVSSLTFSWNNVDGTTNFACPTAGTFTPSGASWSCSPSVLQVDLISSANSASQATQETGAYTIFLSPRADGTATSAIVNHKVYAALCSAATKSCSIKITGLAADQTYYARVISVYNESNLTVCANNCNAPLSGAEVKIDVTGKAQNVLQRLDANLSITGLTGDLPNYALQTNDSLCKLIEGSPGGPVNIGAIGQSDPGCQVD